jgi:hypothetical protein
MISMKFRDSAKRVRFEMTGLPVTKINRIDLSQMKDSPQLIVKTGVDGSEDGKLTREVLVLISLELLMD